MKRRFLVFAMSTTLILVNSSSSSAHVGIETRGVAPTVGSSSIITMRIGHGCTSPDGKMYGTHVFEVSVPTNLGIPLPSAIPGWQATVSPSETKDASGIPVKSTVTWTAKTDSDDVQPGAYFEFGLRLKWLISGPAFLDSKQICRVPIVQRIPAKTQKINGKIKIISPAKQTISYNLLYLLWNLQDGSSGGYSADRLTETGPSPSITVLAKA